VPDEGFHEGEEGDGGGDDGVALDGGVRGGRLHDERAVDALDPAQLGDAPDVDEVVEAGQAQGEHRHQALAPCDHLGPVPELV